MALGLAGLTATQARALCPDGAVGSCQLPGGCTGERQCDGGSWGPCEPVVTSCELANGCPGLSTCAGGQSSCQPIAGDKLCAVCYGTGTQQCDAEGNIVTPCTRVEVCNFCDDDGDGLMDEDFSCQPVRDCGRGIEICADDIDNDCDSSVDEDCRTPDLTFAHAGQGANTWLQWTAAPRGVADLTSLFWPKLAPPELVIGGEINRIRIGEGVYALTCPEKNYGGECRPWTSLGDGFLPWSGEIMSYLRYRLRDFELWSDYQVSLWPDDTEPANDDDGDNVATHIQGLAHDDENWFVSRMGALYQIPLSEDLEDEDTQIWTERRFIPAECPGRNHIGDIDQFEGIVFAPIEKKDAILGDPGPMIAMYESSTLDLLDVKHFPPNTQTRAGWVAINPVDGLLYSGDQNYTIHVYEWRGDSTELELLYTLAMPTNVKAFGKGNGLAFSDSGHMYGAEITNDWGLNPVYLYVFHVVGREVTFNKNVLLIDDFEGDHDVLEGLDVMRTDLLSDTHPQLTGGVHVVFWNPDAIDDNWTILHVDVDDPSLL
ncbi:hypothetical protein [Nannocystis pusilla]|uniref:Uncharacterized protein n=1 Tax=Nannocystis pusilla TaxID=889268 RepID=A0ABS7TPN6_9BACT|nr:hypothetical protein [Nannocystis pusilla]MBZ5710155.1 hypothetical protein [Nannocystis pusilla]